MRIALLVLLIHGVSGQLLVTGCRRQPALYLSGETMGTTFQVTLVERNLPEVEVQELLRSIQERLESINDSMSTWRATSEISRFNAMAAGETMDVSPDFAQVLERALEVAAQTGGAFDPTILPLVEAWGFGARADVAPPSASSLAQLQAQVNHRLVQLVPTPAGGARLGKAGPVRLDLSAIAKGYGVDALCELLVARGYQDFLVEIGGEVRCAGRGPTGQPWRIGINAPTPGIERTGAYQRALQLADQAVATSGDYRNFRIVNGARHSHIIDPRSGQPVPHEVTSVTIVAPTCLDADAIATAVLVLGEADGLAWVRTLPGVEAFLVIHSPDGTVREAQTEQFGQPPKP